MKSEQEEWKDFLSCKKSVLFLLLLAIIGSTLYVIYLGNMNQLPSEYLEKYLERIDVRWSLDGFLVIFFTYFKRYLLVWLLGLVTFMIPISIILAYIYIFSYGFSISWLYVTLGIRGMLKAIPLLGFQGILMTICLLFLIDGILRKIRVFEEASVYRYGTLLLIGGVGCAVITCFEMIMNS